MKIKELEAITGIPRATIRFYEKEGLLSPERKDNGYREYSEEDKDKLMKIKLLRLLSIPVESVRELEAGKLDLTAYMETHVHDLQLTENDIRNAKSFLPVFHVDQIPLNPSISALLIVYPRDRIHLISGTVCAAHTPCRETTCTARDAFRHLLPQRALLTRRRLRKGTPPV